DEQIRATIRHDAEALGYVWDPHGATAAHVYHHDLTDRVARNHDAWVLLATAHPAKFNEIVEPLIGRDMEVPPSLARLLRLLRQEHAGLTPPIPVYKGSRDPMAGSNQFPDNWRHQATEIIDDLGWGEPSGTIGTQDAVDFLVQRLAHASAPAQVLAIGPLTNL